MNDLDFVELVGVGEIEVLIDFCDVLEAQSVSDEREALMGLCGYQSIEQSVHGFPDPGHRWNGCVDDPGDVQWHGLSNIGGNEPIQSDPEEEPGGDVNVVR